MIGNRICPKCGAREEDGASFTRERESLCRECVNKRAREYRKRRPDVFKAIEQRRRPKKVKRDALGVGDPEWKKRKNGWQNDRYARRKDQGLCSDCRKPAVPGKGKCEEHLLKATNAQKAKAAKRMAEKVCVYCGKKPSVTSMHCEDCRKKVNDFRLDYRNRQVEAVKDHYGRECVCCGETEPKFLTLDHKNNDGNVHRKQSHSDMYGVVARMYRTSGAWPEGFQVLCYNCNCGRYRNGGECPHKNSHFSSREDEHHGTGHNEAEANK